MLPHDDDSPMNQDSTAIIQSALDEFIACSKMLEKILILNIVYLDHFVGKGLEQGLVERESQDRQDVRDAGILQCCLPA
jgi:hypothetical protein